MLISSFTTCKTQDNLVTVGYFSDLFVLVIVTDTSAMAENECIRQQYAPHVIPDAIISANTIVIDFSLNLYLPHLFLRLRIRTFFSSPFHCQSNGNAE